MSATCYHFTTTASTNLQPVRAAQTGKLKGWSVANVATAIYIKLYWTAGAPPTVGTTVPNLTVGVVASVNVAQNFSEGVTGGGQLWVAVTAAAADGDSANAAAGAVVTLLVE